MSDINMGTLYDINKVIMLKNSRPLEEQELKEKLEEIKNFCIETNNQYFMLLNRESYDFTLFNTGKAHFINELTRIIYDDFYECLRNRGDILSIDLTNDKTAIEIWISIDKDEARAYYFFPYDNGVIEGRFE